MEVLRQKYFILALLYSSNVVSAEHFCSKDDRRVECIPCADLHHSSNPYRCPKQCDNNVNNQNFCRKVCNKFCLNGLCEYEDGSLKCSEGCKDGLTGRYCQESCPGGCKICDQFKPVCTSCEDGFVGKNCSVQKQKRTIHELLPQPTQTEFPGNWNSSAENVSEQNTVNKESIVAGIVVAVAIVATITTVLIARHRKRITRKKRKEAGEMCAGTSDETGQVNVNPQYSALQGNAVGNSLYTGFHFYENCDAD